MSAALGTGALPLEGLRGAPVGLPKCGGRWRGGMHNLLGDAVSFLLPGIAGLIDFELGLEGNRRGREDGNRADAPLRTMGPRQAGGGCEGGRRTLQMAGQV